MKRHFWKILPMEQESPVNPQGQPDLQAPLTALHVVLSLQLQGCEQFSPYKPSGQATKDSNIINSG